MSLIARLRGTERPRISAHGFQAALNEWADGAAGFNRATIIAQFALNSADEAELDVLMGHFNDANTNAKKLRLRKAVDSVILLLSDRDTIFYTTAAEVNARLAQAAS